MLRPVTKHLQHQKDWQTLSTINAYRCLIAAGLVGMRFSPFLKPFMEITWPALFDAAAILYLLCSFVAVICTMARWPRLTLQIGLFSVLDSGFIAGLCFAGAGIGGGLGALLIVPIACCGALLSLRTTAFIAALATLLLLFQESIRFLAFPAADTAFFPAGILGILFFVFAGLAQWLARRIRDSEALVAAHSRSLSNLYALNQRIIEQVSIGTIALDGNHHIQLANAAAVRLLHLVSTPESGTALPAASPVLNNALDAWLKAPSDDTHTVKVGGRTLLASFASAQAPGAKADNRSYSLIFLEDIQRQNERAQQLKLAAVGRLSAGIAHEIRNPLSALSHATQLLAESTALGPEDKKLLSIIRRHSQRIDRIVDDVMGLSQNGRAALTPIQLRSWLEETVAEYRQLRDNPPQISLHHVDAGQTIRFNPPHLRRVLFNLWQNAENHARRPDIPLRVTLIGHEAENGALCLDVADNGPGFDNAQVDRMLEPFYTTGQEGVGLGLHLARELCESNSARLMPISRPGGACFRIMFATSPNPFDD